MKQILLVFGILVLAAVVYVGGMILFGVLTKFRPKPVEDIAVNMENPSFHQPVVIEDSVLSLLIWNIGYAGLGAETDFFYDGGKMVTAPKAQVTKDLEGIKKYLVENRKTDFILLQETDRKSKRSWKTDQVKEIQKQLPEHVSAFAPNFDVKFLPFPFTNPIGEVFGGLQSLSRYLPSESQRISLPGISDFPRRYFYLDRCLLLQRFPVKNGKNLVVINTHFEAYDKGGTVKVEQRALTKKIMEDEYAKGNYVIVGGDWNIAPPGFNVHQWEKQKEEDELYLMNNDSIYIPGWSYVYDPAIPSNRKNNFPYDPTTTFTTVIDYYFVSPNIEVLQVKTSDMQFAYSDHQPVKMDIKLK
ncbi:MAG: endonuclease/exonuclease/phosphatase family protein [Bacteroidetes bacterium]|nr:endonuclease/exonuclease/phosphatase family protein [Bacteroidota bacterium]